ncbi:MAG: hypothetical protein ACE5FR_04615 [Rhodospirillales bacterium]
MRRREQGTAPHDERACSETASRSTAYRRRWPLALLAAICASCANTDSLPLGPLNTAGYIQETFRTRQFADESRSYTNQNQVQVNANSYFWQPWFVTVEADADVAYEIERGGTSGNVKSVLAAGGGRLGILPLSRYPTSLAYRRRDSRVDGRSVGSDFTSDRVDLSSQAIISTDLRTSALASYQTIDQPGLGQQEQVQTVLSLNKEFERDRLSVRLNFDDEDFTSEKAEDEHETTVIGTAVYDSPLFENVTTQTTTTAIYETDALETQAVDRLSFQGLSTLQWRPAEFPFAVNGALRTLTETIETDRTGTTSNSTETSTKILNGTIGFNYPIRPRLTANAGLNGRIQSIDADASGFSGEVPGESRTTAGGSLIANVNYQSLSDPIIGFDWRWNASGNTNLSSETDDGFTDQESVTLGHSAERLLHSDLLGGLSFRASEEVGLATSTDERLAVDLFHSTSLTHNSSRAGVTTFARLSASDRRDLVSDNPFEFQLLQLLLNRREAIDLTSSWLANLSVQGSRQSSSRDTDTTVSANGSALYRVADVLGVRNLTFTSELALNAIGLESVLTDKNEDGGLADRFRSDWTNRLEYRIGRILAVLEGGMFYNDGKFGNSIFFRIRREFGGGGP